LVVLCTLCRYRHKVHYADLGIMPISLLKSAFWAVSAVVGSA